MFMVFPLEFPFTPTSMIYCLCLIVVSLISLQLQKTNEEQKNKIGKLERAIKIAEV